MTNEHDGSSIDLERELIRYMMDRRITRRQLLDRIASVGAAAALAPIIAACSTSATAAPSPTGTPAPSPSVGGATPTVVPTETAPPTPVPSPETDLYIYNWDAYIGDKTQAEFEKKYGIKVKYDKFPDADTQIAKIRSDGKGGGYDLTYPASTDIKSLAADGVIKALDLSLIPNVKNLGPEWANPPYDPGNKYSIPNYWWTTGYAWNPDKLPANPTSWAELWDGSLRGHLSMLDDVREVFAVAAFRLGLDPNSTNPADLDQMLSLLKQQKPLLRTYTQNDIADLTGGQVWITHAWSGDWWQMLTDKPKTKYVIPTEGAVRGSDTMVVLSGAPHPIAAHLWIDFNLDAKVSAANSNFIGYMGPNAAAQQYIDPTILGDPRLNPKQAVLDKLVELAYLAPTDLQAYTQRWNELRA
jgi:spermidine/putrescine transport system substrate-binding protein